MSQTAGLRERKKRATQHAIERAALDLAAEHGYENVTVEMICEAVTISQRTFFNYAGSKERAVLGIDPPLPSEQLWEAYVAGIGGSPLQDLVATLAAGFSEFAGLGGAEPTLFHRRRSVVEASPELALKEFARLEEAQAVIADVVRRRLAADAPGEDEDEVAAEARMTTSLAFGILHYVMRDWVEGGRGPGDIADALTAAVGLARRVAG